MAVELAELICGIGDELAAVDVSLISAVDAREVLTASERCRRALCALDARLTSVIAGSEGLARDRLRVGLGVSTSEATRRARLAGAVTDMPAAGDALAAGTVSDSHVESLAVARGIAGDRLDTHIPGLLDRAAEMRADDFRGVAIDLARQLSADQGETHHDKLRKRRGLRWWKDRDGMTRMTGDLDPDTAAVVTKAIEQQLHTMWHAHNPTGHNSEPGSAGSADSIDARRLDALTAICTTKPAPEAAPAGPASDPAVAAVPGVVPGETAADSGSPQVTASATSTASAGGTSSCGCSHTGQSWLPRVNVGVLVDYETLCNGLHDKSTCMYDTGDPIPPSLARTLACDADLYPALIDSAREVLDLGRQQRTPNRATRRALNIRDRNCAHPACTAPPAWCDAHHVIDWWGPRRGPTHIDNLILLCRYHHTQLHRGTWTLPDHIIDRAERCLQPHNTRQRDQDQRQPRHRRTPTGVP